MPEDKIVIRVGKHRQPIVKDAYKMLMDLVDYEDRPASQIITRLIAARHKEIKAKK